MGGRARFHIRKLCRVIAYVSRMLQLLRTAMVRSVSFVASERLLGVESRREELGGLVWQKAPPGRQLTQPAGRLRCSKMPANPQFCAALPFSGPACGTTLPAASPIGQLEERPNPVSLFQQLRRQADLVSGTTLSLRGSQ